MADQLIRFFIIFALMLLMLRKTQGKKMSWMQTVSVSMIAAAAFLVFLPLAEQFPKAIAQWVRTGSLR